MDSHGEAAHWSLRLVFHTKKRHCLILSIAAAAEQHLRFSHVPASGDFPLPGLCSPRRGGTRGTMNGGSRAASERSGAGPAEAGHEPREAAAGAPSPQQPPRSRRGRSLQAPARLPAGVSAAPGGPEAQCPLPLPPRSSRGRSRYSQATRPVLPSTPAPPQTNMAAVPGSTSASGVQGRGTAPVLPCYWPPGAGGAAAPGGAAGRVRGP